MKFFVLFGDADRGGFSFIGDHGKVVGDSIKMIVTKVVDHCIPYSKLYQLLSSRQRLQEYKFLKLFGRFGDADCRGFSFIGDIHF